VSFWDILVFEKGINAVLPQPKGIICLLTLPSLRITFFLSPMEHYSSYDPLIIPTSSHTQTQGADDIDPPPLLTYQR